MKGYILPLFMLLLLAAFTPAGAQISTAWTTSISAEKLPSGVSVPDIDTLTGPEKFRMVLDLDASTYDNSDKATAFTALMGAVKSTLDSNYVEAVWGWDPALDRDVVYKVVNVARTWDNITGVDYPDIYSVAEDVFRITVVVKYVVR